MGQCIFDPVYAQADHTTPCCEMFHIIVHLQFLGACGIMRF